MAIQWGGFDVNRFDSKENSDCESCSSGRDSGRERSASSSERSVSPQKQTDIVKTEKQDERKRKRRRNKRQHAAEKKDHADDELDRQGFSEKERFVIKNGCCRECMKAFSKQGKACLCQVPRSQRRTLLADKGCKFCGCYVSLISC